jgi:hypothetical protein
VASTHTQLTFFSPSHYQRTKPEPSLSLEGEEGANGLAERRGRSMVRYRQNFAKNFHSQVS